MEGGFLQGFGLVAVGVPPLQWQQDRPLGVPASNFQSFW